MPGSPLPTVFTRAQASQAGLTTHQIDRLVSTGAWRALRRGVYCQVKDYADASAAERHLLDVRAVLTARTGDVVASHLSAACLFGWPRPLAGWGPVTLTAPPGRSVRRRRGVVVQAASIRPGDRSTRAGQPVTSAARTLADVLRHVPAAEAVAIADHALRSGATSHAQVAEVLRWQADWPYATRGAGALRLVDPRRETWLESVSVVTLFQRGLPLPDAQVDVLDERGRFVARVDVLWEGTVGEADGRVKYDLAGALGAGADPEAAVEALMRRAQRRLDEEKRRQDRLADLGLQVVRWSAAEVLGNPDELVARIQRHLAVAARSRFTGELRRRPAPAWLPQH